MRIKLVCVFFLFTLFAYPQQRKLASVSFKNKALTEVIVFLEKKFDVHFSFQSKDVANQVVNLSGTKKPLLFFLKSLSSETSLIFEILSDKFIAIRKINDSDSINICGTLKNEKMTPLSGATIIFNNKGIITDENGHFKINNLKAGTFINLQYLGFTTKTIQAKFLFQNDCADIILSEKSEQIATIVIKNYLTNGIDKTSTGSFLISPKKMGVLAGLTEPDLFQSIQLLPGVNSPNETATGLHVRGGTPDQNLVIWDGIKVYHSGHLFGAFSPFNPYITKEINFINKGTNAQYGDRISSVIDIKTSDSIQSKLHAGSGINLIAADAYIKLPIIKDKFSVIGSLRRSFTDIYQSKTYHETSDIIFKNTQANTLLSTNSDFFFTDYNLKGIYKFSKGNSLTISSLALVNKLEFGVKEIKDNETDNENNLSFNDFLETDNKGYSFKWYKKWNAKFTQNLKGYYSKYYLRYNKFKGEEEIFAKKNEVKDFGLSYHTSFKINTNTTLNSGYQFSNKDISYLFLVNNNGDLREDQNAQILNTHALYTSFESHTKNNFNVNIGLRANYYQNFQKIYLEPRINIGKYLTPHLLLNVTGEFKTQALSQIDETIESGLSLENRLWSLSNNSTFPIITASQYTFGFSYVKNKWHIDVDTYIKNVKGLVTLNFGFSDVFDNDAHSGKSKIKGFDFYIKKEFRNYTSWLSYTFDDTQNKFKGINDYTYFPGNSNIKHNFYWSQTYKWKHFDFALGWRWHSGKPYSKAIAIVTNSSGNPALQTDGINNFNLPIYSRLDFSTTYNFNLSKTKNIKANVGLSYLNILNKQNILSRDFYIDSSTNQIKSADKVSLERISNFVFRVNF
ncbi:MAG: TonB-dependent receptor [Flavobacteriaceae bacterium]|nr:TonB-dependent receptor [Flavobacteriaceae bacterium]